MCLCQGIAHQPRCADSMQWFVACQDVFSSADMSSQCVRHRRFKWHVHLALRCTPNILARFNAHCIYTIHTQVRQFCARLPKHVSQVDLTDIRSCACHQIGVDGSEVLVSLSSSLVQAAQSHFSTGLVIYRQRPNAGSVRRRFWRRAAMSCVQYRLRCLHVPFVLDEIL